MQKDSSCMQDESYVTQCVRRTGMVAMETNRTVKPEGLWQWAQRDTRDF